jgi:hypothetical protein
VARWLSANVMKVLNYRICYLLPLVLSSWLSACINIEREKHPADRPQLISIPDLKDLDGLYENDGNSTGGDDLDMPMSELWYFLTRQRVSCGKDAVVKITVVDAASIKVELIEITSEGDRAHESLAPIPASSCRVSCCQTTPLY